MLSDQQQFSRRLPTKSGIVIYAVLLTAVLYSLLFHISADSPLRTGGVRPRPLQVKENLQRQIAAQVDEAAGQQNVLLHFQMPNEEWTANASYFVGVYFRAAYELYPRRVYVGSDDRIINFPADLRAADQLPSIGWLRQHQVAGVFAFLPGDATGPRSVVYRVP